MGEEAQTKTVEIIVMKHGRKFGYRLTGEGVAQVFEACEAINAKMAGPTVFVSSNLGHIRQTALVAAASFAIAPKDLGGGTCFESYHFESEKVKEYVGNFPLPGGRVAEVLKKSRSAQEARAYVEEGLRWSAELALMSDASCIFVASHSPLMELAVVNPEDIPYGLDEADAIIYTLQCVISEEEEEQARARRDELLATRQHHEGFGKGEHPSLERWWIASSELVRAPTLGVWRV